jgi:hypothetical protein
MASEFKRPGVLAAISGHNNWNLNQLRNGRDVMEKTWCFVAIFCAFPAIVMLSYCSHVFNLLLHHAYHIDKSLIDLF